jgi:signal transduction histidine kinase
MPLNTRSKAPAGAFHGSRILPNSVSSISKQLLVLILASLFITLSLPTYAQARGPVVLTDREDEYPLGLHLEILPDPTRELTIEEVISPEYDGKFIQNQTKELNPGLVDAAYWIRFRVNNQAVRTGEWWLEIAGFEIDASLYSLPNGHSGLETDPSGRTPPTIEGSKTHHFYPAFQLPLAPHSERTIYLRVAGQRLNLPVTLWSGAGFVRESQKDFVITGLYLGVMLIMAAYNFFLFLALRDKSYLDFVLFMVFALSSEALRKTHDHRVLLAAAVATIMVLFLIRFAGSFLMAKAHAPRLGRVLNGLQIGLGAAALLYVVSSGETLFIRIWFALVLSGLAVVFVVSLVTWRRGYRPARFFVLGQAALLGSFFVALLALLGMAPLSLAEYIPPIGVSLLSIFMSFALADRIHIIRREREVAEAETVQRNRELILLNQVTAITATAMELEAVMRTVCRELGRAFGLTHAMAVLADESGSVARVAADYRTEDQPAVLGQSFQIEGDPLLERISSCRAPVIVNDAQNDPRASPMRERFCLQSSVALLLFPLVVERDIVGGFVLGSSQPGRFSADALGLMQSVVDQMAGVIVRIRLTENQQQLEAQYYQAQKMEAIGGLAGGIAHDFNNLLVPIIGYAELSLGQLPAGGSLNFNLGNIHKAAKQAAALTQQILAFSRKQVLAVKPVDLNDVVNEFHSMLRRLIGEDIGLRMHLAPSLSPVKADRSQVEQILLNLAVNARDAMPDGGDLVIETDNVLLDEKYAETHSDVVPGFYVMVAVGDSGEGMDDETKSRIFEPFFTTKEQGKGTGLGLATVHGIVKQHGGHVWIYSEPGKGTVFKIYLPQADEPVQPEPPVSEHPPQVGTETVLVVEDDDSVRGLVCRTLESHGYQVLMAENPETAIEIASGYPDGIDLLLTDVIMPGMNGGELAKEMRTMIPDIRVLYMSGYTENVIVRDGILIGNTNHLAKPFSIRGLTQKVRTVLDE